MTKNGPIHIIVLTFILVVSVASTRGRTSAESPPAGRTLGERETLALIVRTVGSVTDEATRESLLTGMLLGLEGRRAVAEPEGWSAVAERLVKSESRPVREATERLSQIFGNREANERALATLTDSFAPVDQRKRALASLVTQQYEGLSQHLEALLDDDALKIDVIRAYGIVADKAAPKRLLKRYRDESGEVQRAIVETLATRKEYAVALVGAIGDRIVDRDHVPTYVARSLRDLIGKPFTEVYGEVSELQQDTGATIAKYKRLITDDAMADADAGRGRAVFNKTCGACHLMYGSGGKVGPDLTGSNRANLDYFLLNSVDPSADVPEGYRTQIVQTVDGRIVTGVLAEEDSQRIVLKTVDQPRVVIAKEDIEARKVSKKSMMPEGQLDQLSRGDLFDLVQYLRTTTQVDTAQPEAAQ